MSVRVGVGTRVQQLDLVLVVEKQFVQILAVLSKNSQVFQDLVRFYRLDVKKTKNSALSLASVLRVELTPTSGNRTIIS